MGNAASVVEEAKGQGNARFAKGDLAGAVKLYKHALEAGGSRHLLHSNLSATYLAADMLLAALAAADAAVAAKPDWPKAHFRRGAALAAMGFRQAHAVRQRRLAQGRVRSSA